MKLTYAGIEAELIEALPELRPAAETYWKKEGEPGSDAGPYIFFESMFACYVEILLAMSDSARRSNLLRRAFEFVETMLAASEQDLQNLAGIGLFEGRPSWWHNRASPFIGPLAQAEVERWYGRPVESNGGETPERDFIDLYGVRKIVAFQLRDEGISLSDVPGKSYDEQD